MLKSVRTAGVLLCLSMLLWIAMIAAWPILIGETPATSADESTAVIDRANHLLDRQFAHRGVWATEALGAIGMAVAALVLIQRPATRNGMAPIGWAAVCVGSTVYIAMYGLMLGTYWPAAEAAADTPALLASAITGAMALFFLSNIAFNAGLTIVFLAEARLEGPAIPRWVVWPGLLLSLLAFAGSLAGLITSPTVSAVGALSAVELVAIAHFVLIAIFGAGLARSRD